MARPRKQSDTQQTRQVIFRLTAPEYAVVEAVAQRAGLGVNDLARRFTRRVGRRIIITVSRRADPALIAQLRALGNNLNQLTMRSHLTGEISPKVEILCEEIRRIVLEAIEEP